MDIRGVKKVSEKILQQGRTLVINDMSIEASQVSDGTIRVDPETGEMYIKVTTEENVAEWKLFESGSGETMKIHVGPDEPSETNPGDFWYHTTE